MAVWAHSGLAQQTILVSAADMASVSSLSRLDRTISSVVMVCSGWNVSHPNDVMCVLGILSILRLKNKTTLLSLFFSALSLLVHLFLVTFSLSGFLFFSPEFVLRKNCLDENGLERWFFFVLFLKQCVMFLLIPQSVWSCITSASPSYLHSVSVTVHPSEEDQGLAEPLIFPNIHFGRYVIRAGKLPYAHARTVKYGH